MSDIAVPKNQVLLDRLRKRIDGYRSHHDDSIPRFEQTSNGINEEQRQQTIVLQQRFVESKAKKSHKKGDKKDPSSNNSNKSHKRQIDDSSCEHGQDNYEPPKKLSFSTSPTKAPRSSKIKFLPPESRVKNGLQQHSPIPTQQLPLPLPPPPPPPPPHHHLGHMELKQESSSCGYVDLDQCAAALEKDGPDGIINSDTLNDLISEISDFSSADFMKDFDFGEDLESKSDSATLVIVGNLSSNPINNNSTNLGENSHPYPVTPITPTNLNSPMHSNNQQHQHSGGIKMEDNGGMGGHMGGLLGHGPSPAPPATNASPLASQLSSQGGTPPYLFDPTGSPAAASSSSSTPNNNNNSSTSKRFNSPAATLPIDSPAAQTLKQMAEQHQHKAQMGMNSGQCVQAGGQGQSQNQNSFKNSGASPARSPFNEYGQFPPPPSSSSSSSNEFMGASSNVNSSPNPNAFSSNRPPPLGVEMGPGGGNVKQEVYSPTTQTSFSPGFMDVNVKRVSGGMSNHIGGNRMQHPQQVLSPVNKSFNHSGGGMDPSLMSGQSYRPPNNLPSNPSTYQSFPSPQQISNNPQQPQMAGRGSPSGPMDNKVRMSHPPQGPPQQGTYYYPNNMNAMDTSPQYNHMGGMQQQQQNGPQGQTINFTQQHLRIGGPSSGNMAPRMNAPPNMASRMPGPGPVQRGPPPPSNQQQPPPNQQQQQLMMRQQQQQHMAQQQQQQMVQPPPGIMNRFSAPNVSRGGPVPGSSMQQVVSGQQQMANAPPSQRPPPHMQPQHQQQHQQMYNNSNGQQHMGIGGTSMGNMHMRQQNMSPYNNNGNHMMSNGPQQPQQPNMQMVGREWMNMDPGGGRGPPPPPQQQQQQFPPQNSINSMGRQQQQGPRSNMQQMNYHSGMQSMQMQSQQPGGGMMPNSYNPQGGGGGGGMGISPQMGYNPQQMQQLGGFNHSNHVKSGPGGYCPPIPLQQQNPGFMPLKSNNGGVMPMCQQQPGSQQMFQQQGMVKQQQQPQMGMSNEINIDQMLNISDDPNAYSGGDTADLFNSLDSNFILDDL